MALGWTPEKECIIALLLVQVTMATYRDPACAEGRSVIVHLFNWKWSDIAAECERFLGPNHFCGVQVSPPNEHRVEPGRPWWERYQPVSYGIDSRSGNRSAFIDMVTRCHVVDVRIFVDVVINHMAGGGEGALGSAGSPYDSATLHFPAVPFGQGDFNCCGCRRCPTASCTVENYRDANQVRNCRLLGMADLDLGKRYVRHKVAAFLNDLVDIGVAGFRVDACKHMWPGDLEAIYGRLHDLREGWFPAATRPFIYQEVIDGGGEPITAREYTHLGRVTEFKYSAKLGAAFRGETDLRYLRTFGEAWEFLPSDAALVFVDNHDNQRGHGGGGANVVTFKRPRRYKMATAFALAWPYGVSRIMSSFRWEQHQTDQGPPAYADHTIRDVTIGADGACEGGWVCEHRWRPITNMAAFRNTAGTAPVEHWWDDGRNQIAFSRASRAFLAINGGDKDMIEVLQTGLPEGVYCDVISGKVRGWKCSGSAVIVGYHGEARIEIPKTSEDPMIAITIDSRVDVAAQVANITNVADVTDGADVTKAALLKHSADVTDADFTETSDVPRVGEVAGAVNVARGAGVARGADVTDAADVTKVPDVKEAAYVTEAADVTKVPDVKEAAYVKEAADVTKVHDVIEAAYVTTATEVTKVVDVTQGPDVTEAVPPGDFRRTVVLLHFVSRPGQDVFLRGGASHSVRTGCSQDASLSACALSIRHLSPGPGDHYRAAASWQSGDTRLDWYGPEVDQGLWEGRSAAGSPGLWTTDAAGHPGFHRLNRFGPHYWLWDMSMNCSQTENGWFELKGYVTGVRGDVTGWERDVTQAASCGGGAGGNAPYPTTNHMARCGFLNVFDYGRAACLIEYV